MLWYIIDGWNLLNKIEDIKNKKYHTLISYIKSHNLTGSKNNKVTVVFDGFFLPEKDDRFQIIFSREKSADEVIEVLVERSKNRKQIIVVTDDLEIIRRIKLLGAGYRKTKEFLAKRKKRKKEEETKKISYSLQREITEELKKIWQEKF
ncbi:MAG: hypothetical protein B6D55_01365 [Candidatus Omnitrophica bacterium 4484_70.2]|nr:MAG: hypothetical protein B6D55_01365 [Candidatus Omnitrophica bacterium 4484_70.2]